MGKPWAIFGLALCALALVSPARVSAAEEKVRGENLVRKALAEGMSVTEAFRRYGVL